MGDQLAAHWLHISCMAQFIVWGQLLCGPIGCLVTFLHLSHLTAWPICCMVTFLHSSPIYCIIAVVCMQCDQFTVITNSLYGDFFVLKPICCMVDNLLCGDSLHISQFAIWQISYIAVNWLHICSVVTRLYTQICCMANFLVCWSFGCLEYLLHGDLFCVYVIFS